MAKHQAITIAVLVLIAGVLAGCPPQPTQVQISFTPTTGASVKVPITVAAEGAAPSIAVPVAIDIKPKILQAAPFPFWFDFRKYILPFPPLLPPVKQASPTAYSGTINFVKSAPLVSVAVSVPTTKCTCPAAQPAGHTDKVSIRWGVPFVVGLASSLLLTLIIRVRRWCTKRDEAGVDSPKVDKLADVHATSQPAGAGDNQITGTGGSNPGATPPPETQPSPGSAKASCTIAIDLSAPSLSDLSNSLYRDITLADAKAVFAFTIASAAIAAALSFISANHDEKIWMDALNGWGTQVWFGLGLAFALQSIVLSVITVLPRKYVQVEVSGDEKGEACPINDALQAFTGNWYFADDGAIDLLTKTLHEKEKQPLTKCSVNSYWFAETKRQRIVRHRKYWYVGPAIICACLAVFFIIVGVLIVLW